jgi:hypothetical protein
MRLRGKLDTTEILEGRRKNYEKKNSNRDGIDSVSFDVV